VVVVGQNYQSPYHFRASMREDLEGNVRDCAVVHSKNTQPPSRRILSVVMPLNPTLPTVRPVQIRVHSSQFETRNTRSNDDLPT
jgi:hypothetical protein